MNVLFVVVKTIEPGERCYPAAGICYVAAAVKNAGHKTFGLNLSRYEDQQEALSAAILKNNIEVVCIGGLSKDFNDVEFIANCCKTIKANISVVVGGHLISTEPELAVRNLNIDYGVIGPGEQTSVELLNALGKNSPSNLKDIPGLVYLTEDRQLIKTRPREETNDLDSINYPDFPLLYDDEIRESGSISITASRGCPYKCTFCSRTDSNKRYLQRSLDSIFAELDYWRLRYDLKAFAILDDLFAAKADRLRQFCRRIKPYQLPFAFQSRVDIMTEELLALLKDAGCQTISYGLESVNDKILRSMKKGITFEQISRAVLLTKKYDMRVVGNFIFGDIEETWETANESLNWWAANSDKTDIYLTPICLHPGTFLYEYAVDKGIIRDKLKFLKDGCPILNVSKMSQEEVNRLHRKIDHLLSIKDRPLSFSIAKVNSDNSVNAVLECLSCLKMHEIRVDLPSDSRYGFICPNCSQKNRLVAEDLFKPVVYKQALDDFSERYFRQFEKAHKRIVIWGAKQRAQMLLLSSPSLRKCTVKVVDSAFNDYRGKLLGLFDVESPESLSDFDFDYLLIATVRYRSAITYIAKKQMKLEAAILDL